MAADQHGHPEAPTRLMTYSLPQGVFEFEVPEPVADWIERDSRLLKAAMDALWKLDPAVAQEVGRVQ